MARAVPGGGVYGEGRGVGINKAAFRRSSAFHAPSGRHSGWLAWLSLLFVVPALLGGSAERQRGLHLVEGFLHEALQFCVSQKFGDGCGQQGRGGGENQDGGELKLLSCR